MRKTITLVAGCLLFASLLQAVEPGTAVGKMTVGGKTTELHYALARTTKNPFHDKQTDFVVLITNLKVTPEQWADFSTMFDLAGSGRLTGVELEIAKDNQIISGQIYSPLFKLQGNSFSATGMHEFQPESVKGGDISGKVMTSHESSFNNVSFSYNATFHAMTSVPKPEPAVQLKGAALPAGGGDPGKAYAAYLKTVSSGNMAALKKAVTSDRAKQMDDPDFKKMFPLIQAMQPKKIVITGGAIDGDSATLTATGDQDGTPATGSIDMKREGGVWKVEHESWKSKSSR